MCRCARYAFPLLLWITLSAQAGESKWIELSTSLDPWKGRTEGWIFADSVTLDAKNPRKLSAQAGKAILVNGPGRVPDLISKETWGDQEVHVEFLIAKRSNSGVKLHGHYEIQIADSHGVKEPTGDDCGGVYPRAEQKPKYHHIDKGIPPKTNAARPAGEWQTLDIIFQAPRFDSAGKKTVNARLVKVVLNGQVIHENVELLTPTGHAWKNPEMARGPLLLQGDHGPVAFRNVRVRPWTPGKQPATASTEPWSADDVVNQETALSFRIAPDCRSVVWVKRAPDKDKGELVSHLMLSSLTEKNAIQLTRGSHSASNPRWSPDGKLLAFLSARPAPKSKAAGRDEDEKDEPKAQVWLINPAGGEPWVLTQSPRDVRDFAWAGNDHILCPRIEPRPST